MNFESTWMNSAFLATHKLFVQGTDYEASLHNVLSLLGIGTIREKAEVVIAAVEHLNISDSKKAESDIATTQRASTYDRVLKDILQNVPGLEKFMMDNHDLRTRLSAAFHAIPEIHQPSPTRIDPTNAEHRHLKVLLAQRDHAVVNDFSSKKGYKVIALEELKKLPHKTKVFVATRSECQKWVDAIDAAARAKIEEWAEARHQKRVPLPSEVKESDTKEKVKDIMDKFNLPVQATLFGQQDKSENKDLKL